MENLKEKRKLPRISASSPVTLYTAAGEVAGKTKNIASNGAYVECNEQLKPSEAFWLQIRVPRRDLMLMGIVIWSNLVIDKFGEDTSHAGLSFIHI